MRRDSRGTLNSRTPPTMTLFEKIIAREIPADIIYEDDFCVSFRDINPKAPVHVLIVPKRVLSRPAKTQPDVKDPLFLFSHSLSLRNLCDHLLERGASSKLICRRKAPT